MRSALFCVFGLTAFLAIVGCSGGKSKSGTSAQENDSKRVKLSATGSSFVLRLMQVWAEKAQSTGTRVDYISTGSTKGIQDMLNGETDFGCTDAPLTDEQMQKAGGKDKVLHIPLAMGAVVAVYNLPDLADKRLKLDGKVLADVYLGIIKNWNDQAIAALNPDLKLPDLPITVCRRSDGSGTTYIFTNYLAGNSDTFKQKVGPGTQPNWPAGVGQGGPKNDGVAALVEGTPGAIGYIELTYALDKKKLRMALLKSADGGEFVEPTIASVTAAAAGLKIPEDLIFSLVNIPGKGVYPACGVVWAVAKTDASKADGIRNFLKWALGKAGQELATPEHYAPLPDSLAAKAVESLEKLKGK
jgi:phosphate transport system substrate-binding protein